MLRTWGVYDETFDSSAGTGGTALAAGRLYHGLLGLNPGDLVGNIVAGVTVAGAGAPPTLIKFGIADALGVILAVTGNVNADAQLLVANAFAKFPLTAAYPIKIGSGYQMVALAVGTWATTQATFHSRSVAAPGVGPIGAGVKKFGNTSGTGNTDLVVGNTLPVTVQPGVAYYMAAAP